MVRALGILIVTQVLSVALVCIAVQMIINLLSHGSTNASDFFQLLNIGIGYRLGTTKMPKQFPPSLGANALDAFEA